jgi:predicted secreted protein
MMKYEGTMITPLDNPLIRLIAGEKYRWLRHGAFIIMGFILAFKGDVGIPKSFRSPELSRAILWTDLFTFFFMMGLMYLVILVLVPKLLFRSKFFLFAIAILAIVTLIYFAIWWVDIKYLLPLDNNSGAPQIEHVELSLFSYIQLSAILIVLLGAVIGMTIFKKWLTVSHRMNEIIQMQIRTELEQLKSQINPHFLFNTLNNLLVLLKTDPEKASQVLLGLSDLLRYLLYDGAHEEILLSKDLEFIRNLLSLEKIRKNNFEYKIVADQNINNLMLPPFLFIPFVENAIKHGASANGHSYLNLHFAVRENKLYFTAENSNPKVKNGPSGGLGLKNIRRRLDLLYPETHSLKIDESDDTYFVQLILPI